MSARISILIVNYNTRDYVLRCIESIYASDIDPGLYEILVWDNHSADGSVEQIRKQYPEVILLEAKYNYGFAVGMNQLYARSTGEYVMTFNPDAEVFPGTLGKIIAFMDAHPGAGMIGMSVKDSSGLSEVPYHVMPAIDPFHLLKKFKKNKTVTALDNIPFQVDYIWGTAIVARRALLGEQFFEERAFLFWEEYDLAKKIHRQNSEVYIVPAIEVLHHASVSFKFNKEKTKITRGLSVAWAYYYKKKEFGLFKAKMQVLCWIMDNALLSGFLSIKNIFGRDQGRSLMIVQYSSVLKKSLQLLFSGTNAVLKTNATAARLLNQGTDPVYPPQFSQIR